ncbi:MAG: dicarboxylate/amino acid:cation symporter [Firmicutes bacterium]|nr:dicarboxylate/amino acid:cation symporter [Dethiobacter sp.]MBS3889145.1 dicarboxylate/amino acid:cation symporter [Bacillota bacterium]
MKIANRILYGLIAGIIIGLLLHTVSETAFARSLMTYLIAPVGDAFIRAIRMLVVPLVLASLVIGTASLGDLKKVGRIGGKIMSFYLVTTAIAILIGLALTLIFQPGLHADVAKTGEFKAAVAPPIMTTLIEMIPTNPIDSLARGAMLQIIVFAVLLGIGIAAVGDVAKPLLKVFEGLNDVMLWLTTLVMQIAPYGVAALIARTVINVGPAILISLAMFILVIYLGFIIHLVVVYGGIAKFFGGVSLIELIRRVSPAMLLAFTTASSAATLPVTLMCSEKNLGIKKEIGAFTLPLGATVNMDGTALYQGVSVVFLAQLLGIDLTINQMLTVIVSATLASIGTAGVPGAGMIMLAMVLESVGMPVSAIGIIMGVDRIVDMGRTTMNVTGDLACTLAVARSENAVDLPTRLHISTGGKAV